MPKNTDARCAYNESGQCPVRWSERDQRWYWPGGGFARTELRSRSGVGDHTHRLPEIEEAGYYRDAFGHVVQFRGIERVSYANVKCVLFVSVPIPDKPGEYYDWKGGEVTTWPQARDAYMQALNEGCRAFYFALPDQLVAGVPVDTRLR